MANETVTYGGVEIDAEELLDMAEQWDRDDNPVVWSNDYEYAIVNDGFTTDNDVDILHESEGRLAECIAIERVISDAEDAAGDFAAYVREVCDFAEHERVESRSNGRRVVVVDDRNELLSAESMRPLSQDDRIGITSIKAADGELRVNLEDLDD